MCGKTLYQLTTSVKSKQFVAFLAINTIIRQAIIQLQHMVLIRNDTFIKRIKTIQHKVPQQPRITVLSFPRPHSTTGAFQIEGDRKRSKT